MKTISLIHTFLGVVSLVSVAINLSMTKGTLIHRYVGWIYSVSMYLLIFTSFNIYRVFGSFGVFHILSVVSGLGLTVALFFLIFKKNLKYG